MTPSIVLSTMCLVSAGVKPEVIKSTQVFEVPAQCVAKWPFSIEKSKKEIFSDGSYKFSDICSSVSCDKNGYCSSRVFPCSPAVWPWWNRP